MTHPIECEFLSGHGEVSFCVEAKGDDSSNRGIFGIHVKSGHKGRPTIFASKFKPKAL